MNFLMFIFFVVFIFLIFYYSIDYLISVLVFVEFMMLTLIVFYLFFYDCDFLYFSVYMVVLSVCEGVLGLSSMILVTSWYGSDMLVFGNLVYYFG